MFTEEPYEWGEEDFDNKRPKNFINVAVQVDHAIRSSCSEEVSELKHLEEENERNGKIVGETVVEQGVQRPKG